MLARTSAHFLLVVVLIAALLAPLAARGAEAGLVAYYPLNGDAQDASGNGNHGQVHGATPVADRAGTANAAMHFDGGGNFIEIANSESVNIAGNTSLTVGAWVRPAANPALYMKAVVWKWGPQMEEDDQYVFGVGNGGAFFGLSDLPSRITTAPLPLNSWTSLVGVYDAKDKMVRMYVNGELEATKRLVSEMRKTEAPLYLGRGEVESQSYAGDLDDVRIYNRALSPEEVRKLYKGISFDERMEKVAASVPRPPTADEVEKEIEQYYAKADADVKEYIRWTARQFGRAGLWKAADTYKSLSVADRETRVQDLISTLSADYGRHLCPALADAGVLKDRRLIPGIVKAAAYHLEDADYDCRAKWMAVAALGRQDDPSVVPVLVPLVDHGNQNTRMWARASLVRLTGQNFGDDKKAWAKWWNDSGHQPAIDIAQLKPWKPIGEAETPPAPQQEAAEAPPGGGTGPKGKFLRFDGKNDFVHFTDPKLDLKGSFSVSGWARAGEQLREGPIYFRGDPQFAHDPCQLVIYGSRVRFRVDGGTGEQERVRYAEAPLQPGWRLWTGVYDAKKGELRIYMDGELVNQAPIPESPTYDTSKMYSEIGAVDSGKWGIFKGDIDQVSVWNVARSAKEIQKEFKHGLKGNEKGLVALWTFDEDGQQVKDAAKKGTCSATLGRTSEPDDCDPARVTIK